MFIHLQHSVSSLTSPSKYLPLYEEQVLNKDLTVFFFKLMLKAHIETLLAQRWFKHLKGFKCWRVLTSQQDWGSWSHRQLSPAEGQHRRISTSKASCVSCDELVGGRQTTITRRAKLLHKRPAQSSSQPQDKLQNQQMTSHYAIRERRRHPFSHFTCYSGMPGTCCRRKWVRCSQSEGVKCGYGKYRRGC